MNRKIIQIAMSESAGAGAFSRFIIALCDDGTVWQRKGNHLFNRLDTERWEQVPTAEIDGVVAP